MQILKERGTLKGSSGRGLSGLSDFLFLEKVLKLFSNSRLDAYLRGGEDYDWIINISSVTQKLIQNYRMRVNKCLQNFHSPLNFPSIKFNRELV